MYTGVHMHVPLSFTLFLNLSGGEVDILYLAVKSNNSGLVLDYCRLKAFTLKLGCYTGE